MIHRIQEYLAIRSYVRRLSQDLVHRFGSRPFYSVEHVSKAAERGGYSMNFIRYAHAAFCSQPDFEAQYRSRPGADGYMNLRHTIAQRYFSGAMDFDAAIIFRKYRANDFQDGFHESGAGGGNGGD